MKYSKEKIKAGAVALLFIAGTSAIVAAAAISAVQGVKTETEVERLTKAHGKKVKRIQEILPNFRYLTSKYGKEGDKK